MATLTKHGNQYLSRIRSWNGYKQETITVPLKTNNKSDAHRRHKTVERNEKDIKDRVILKHQFKSYFEWLNDKGTSTLVQLSIREASERFLKDYAVNIAPSSLRRIKVSLRAFMLIIKDTRAIRGVCVKDIEDFKKIFQGTPAGTNLNLRNIKTFLRWCVEQELLDKCPKIRMLKEPKRFHAYIKEDTLRHMLELEKISPFMRRAFYFYATTGCRRSEAIDGYLDGKVLIVDADISKSRIERRIYLQDAQVEILKEIHMERDTRRLKGHSLKTFKDSFTRTFRNALKHLYKNNLIDNYDNLSFHSLRHFYAVKTWIETNDIYEVKKLLGHSSIKTTERYAEFPIEQLKYDFPTAYELRLRIQEIRNNSISTQLISTQILKINESSSESLQRVSDC